MCPFHRSLMTGHQKALHLCLSHVNKMQTMYELAIVSDRGSVDESEDNIGGEDDHISILPGKNINDKVIYNHYINKLLIYPQYHRKTCTCSTTSDEMSRAVLSAVYGQHCEFSQSDLLLLYWKCIAMSI